MGSSVSPRQFPQRTAIDQDRHLPVYPGPSQTLASACSFLSPGAAGDATQDGSVLARIRLRKKAGLFLFGPGGPYPGSEGQRWGTNSLPLSNPHRTLTSPLSPPNMSTQCPRHPNPWGRRCPITASSTRSGAGAWVWCTRPKTSSSVVMLP